jgi:hypothetical protein
MSDLSRLCALKQTLLLDKALVVDFEAERLVGCKEIGAIDEQRNLVGGRWHSVVTSITLDKPTSRLIQPVLELRKRQRSRQRGGPIRTHSCVLERLERMHAIFQVLNNFHEHQDLNAAMASGATSVLSSYRLYATESS